jgi:hypothetical protein
VRVGGGRGRRGVGFVILRLMSGGCRGSLGILLFQLGGSGWWVILVVLEGMVFG